MEKIHSQFGKCLECKKVQREDGLHFCMVCKEELWFCNYPCAWEHHLDLHRDWALVDSGLGI